MSKVEQIESEITKLTPEEVRRVAEWLAEYEAELWDKQIEEDATARRLDFLFEEADAERKTGKLRDWPPEQK